MGSPSTTTYSPVSLLRRLRRLRSLSFSVNALLTSASSWVAANTEFTESSIRAPATTPVRRLGCSDGARDRQGEKGPSGLRLRRHRDCAVEAHARPG